jgi:hypothetical protein
MFHPGSCYLRIEYCDAFIACIRNSALRRTEGRAIGTEAKVVEKCMLAYDQHRRSSYLRGTACYALPDEKRINVTAAPRPNMSTAALERRPAKLTRGGGQ